MMILLPKPNRKLDLGRLIKHEHGASIVELLVAMSISVLIFGILTTSLVQFMLITRWGNDQLIVTNDIQVTSLWVGRDALEASSFTPGSGTIYGTLNWADSTHQYRYSYDVGSSGLSGSILRTAFYNQQ